MSGIRSFLCSLSLAGAVAVLHNSDRILRREGCKPACWPECPQAARTGVPCLPSAEKWPYKTHDSWNSELGERVVHAAIPSNATSEDACQGFKQFGDAAWCLAAFAGEEGVVGLSFGIEQRDLWSETMSNFFHMKTKLYDCFQDPSSSPPLAMKAPNAQGPCTDVKGHCYETAYEAFRTCLGPSTTTVEDRAYVALPTLLEHKAPLSVHLKMDVEGSEWSVLEDLLSHPGGNFQRCDLSSLLGRFHLEFCHHWGYCARFYQALHHYIICHSITSYCVIASYYIILHHSTSYIVLQHIT